MRALAIRPCSKTGKPPWPCNTKHTFAARQPGTHRAAVRTANDFPNPITDAAMHNALHTGLARYLSTKQIEALHAARVGIAGAGGLGSNAALMLARSGIGNLLVVDDDVVDASNLNRQQYWPRHVGRPKVEALAELLLELNPAMQVETRRMRMDQHNIATVLPACPIWVEAFDGPDDKTLLVETALLGGYRIASASGMGGWGGKAMGKRYLGNLVLVGDFETDILEYPPLAPRVTEAAALLADAMLEFILTGVE